MRIIMGHQDPRHLNNKALFYVLVPLKRQMDIEVHDAKFDMSLSTPSLQQSRSCHHAIILIQNKGNIHCQKKVVT